MLIGTFIPHQNIKSAGKYKEHVFIIFRQEDLFKVLKAYVVHNPVDGYCQAQAPIAAVLLMHMPAEQAFWCLVSICEKYLPGYYSAGLVSGVISVICFFCQQYIDSVDVDKLFTLLFKSVSSVWCLLECSETCGLFLEY